MWSIAWLAALACGSASCDRRAARDSSAEERPVWLLVDAGHVHSKTSRTDADAPSAPSLWKTEDERQPLPASAELLDAPGFQFTMGEGSGMSGYDTFITDEHGQTQVLLGDGDQERDHGKVLRFRLSSEELRRLKELLVTIDYLALKKTYRANVNDGTQWFVKLTTTTFKKGVYLDNYFPEPIVRLSRFVHGLVDAHRARAKVDRADVDLLWRKLVGAEHF